MQVWTLGRFDDRRFDSGQPMVRLCTAFKARREHIRSINEAKHAKLRLRAVDVARAIGLRTRH